MTRVASGLCLLLASACIDHPAPPSFGTDTDGETDGDTEGTAPFPESFAVTADWRNHSISVVDLDALRGANDSTTAQDVIWRTHDLAQFEPGPLELEIIPGMREAIVAVGPGFFDTFVGGLIGATNVPVDGALLRVDLETGEVLGSIDTPSPAMGIEIDATASRAYVANHTSGGDSMSVIDLDDFTIIEDVVIGAGPEQIDLNADGTLGIINAAGDGTIRVFQTADPGGTLSPPVVVSNDSSWPMFIDGTDFAVVTNSRSDENYTVLDVSDPALPVISLQGPEPGGIPYPGAPIPGTTKFVMVDTIVDTLGFIRVDVAADPAAIEWRFTIDGYNSFPLGVSPDPDGRFLYVAAPGDNQLVVVDMDADHAVTIDWLPRVGPTYIALPPT